MNGLGWQAYFALIWTGFVLGWVLWDVRNTWRR